MRLSKRVLTAAVAVTTVALAAPAAMVPASAAKSNVKVGLAYDIGGRGDKSFNDAAARGLDLAKKKLGITF